MKAITSRLPALTCALLLPLSALIIWPVVELGVNDEWSYVKTVQVLVQTGHIVYNGWTAVITGWMFYLGGLFVKLFGFSFTTIRLSMLVVAMATIYLTHRTMVRCGINNWNATLGTLALALSPLFVPLTLNFMTDVPGLFCLLLCFYACVRALDAESDDDALAWLCFAAVSNAVLGTSRQIAWLGLLVMVPSALWLLRKRPRFLTVGVAVYLASVAFIFAALFWFHHQPYSVPEELIQAKLNVRAFENVIAYLFASAADIPTLLLPLLLFFVPAVPRTRTTAKVFVVVGVFFAALSLVQALLHKSWLVPYIGHYVSIFGILGNGPLHGPMPVVLHAGVRLVLTLLVVLGTASFIAVVMQQKQQTPAVVANVRRVISWYDLLVLLVPFTLTYFVLLIPRAIPGMLYDRYILALLFLGAIPVARCYQERVRPQLPALALLPIGIYGFFAIAGTHDSFVRFRAYVAVINELRSRGVPATAIDGGLEYNGWVQINKVGYVNDPGIPTRPGDRFRPPIQNTFGSRPAPWVDFFPALSFRYAMSTDPNGCLGPAGFPPVSYRTWLSPHLNTIYVVKVGRPDNSGAKSENQRNTPILSRSMDTAWLKASQKE